MIDTGISGAMPEFPEWKRSTLRWSYRAQMWTDLRGHGSMVACIAAGTKGSGGRFNGVAPGATLISCKTGFDDTELFQIYEFLLQQMDTGPIRHLVINNSYGLYSCAPVAPAPPLAALVRTAVARGAVIVFAAGNNHVQICRNQPSGCGPNSIWGVNSLEDVITVGTVDRDNSLDQPAVGYSHCDSSRGPGQFARSLEKPDCVAPTYGGVLWGSGYVSMPWWGTSGAAPQVAGLAALLLEKHPDMSPQDVKNRIRGTCTPLPFPATCVGAGLIDCARALGDS